MASPRTQDPSSTKDREVVISRVIDAPRELVFEAWTNPEHVAKWWGPDGFTTTTREIDVRVGGAWRFVMHGPDGVDYENSIEYREIVPPERLVYLHTDPGDAPMVGGFEATVTFEDREGKTEVTMRSVFATAEARDFVIREFGAIEGGKQHLARLAAFVER